MVIMNVVFFFFVVFWSCNQWAVNSYLHFFFSFITAISEQLPDWTGMVSFIKAHALYATSGGGIFFF